VGCKFACDSKYTYLMLDTRWRHPRIALSNTMMVQSREGGMRMRVRLPTITIEIKVGKKQVRMLKSSP